MGSSVEDLHRHLVTYALSLPGAWEDHPWGEVVAKIGKKVFVFFGVGESPRKECTVCVKLPDSGLEAKLLPFCEPAGYGLGKSGWVVARIGPKHAGMSATAEAWILESFRAVATKTQLKALDAPVKEKPTRKRSPKKKAARKAPVKKRAPKK